MRQSSCNAASARSSSCCNQANNGSSADAGPGHSATGVASVSGKYRPTRSTDGISTPAQACPIGRPGRAPGMAPGISTKRQVGLLR